jgi:hypothetical protein
VDRTDLDVNLNPIASPRTLREDCTRVMPAVFSLSGGLHSFLDHRVFVLRDEAVE